MSRSSTLETTPLVSVVIPTRDRGDDVVQAAASVLANDYPRLELIVVDQSSDNGTELALGQMTVDPRFELIRSATTGISTARNLGIERARGEWIGLTDDDCEVAVSWARCIAESFRSHSTTGLVFGVVTPGEHDETAGFVPGYRCDEPARARTVGRSYRVGGMGACMATRKSVWRQVQGFDPRLGVGSRLGSGEETDYSIRVLLAGYSVALDPDLEVLHHGFRTWESGKELIRRYWCGTGAAFAMNARTAPGEIGRALMGMGRGWVLGRSPVAKSLGAQSHRCIRLFSFAQGFLIGLTLSPLAGPGASD